MKKISLTLLLLSSFLLIIISGCNQLKERNNSEKPGSEIEIVAHRGANRQGPENTFASAKKAIQYGADYVEIDIRRSMDGVYFIIHDRTLDRTTDGTGLVSGVSSEYIDGLDAGSWFGYGFVGEHVPRLTEFLQWIKGKAKVLMNISEGDITEIAKMVYDLELKDDCLFSFSDLNAAKEFGFTDKDLALKIKASSVSLLDSLITTYNPQVIECEIATLTDEFIQACHDKMLKVMASVLGNDLAGYRQAVSMNIDLINLDAPGIFSNMLENNGIFKDYKLIAHRGGITGGEYNEFDPASIQAAIDRGYYMLELDIRRTKDGVLIVNHDSNFRRFFNDPRNVDEVTWEEVQSLKSDRGNYHPLSFEEVAGMCSGKVKLMIEIKVPDSSPDFYKKLGDIMEKYDLLEGAYFLGEDMEPFMEKAKMSINMSQIPRLMEMLKEGKEVARHYFLFDAGTRMTSSVVKFAQQNYITVVAAINVHNYVYEDDMQGAQRDIEFFKECGVTEFQIDSQYDKWLPVK